MPACPTVAALHGCAQEGWLGAASRAWVGVHLPVALGPSRSSECAAGIVVLVVFNFLMALLGCNSSGCSLQAVVFLPSVVRIVSQGALTSVAIKQMT